MMEKMITRRMVRMRHRESLKFARIFAVYRRKRTYYGKHSSRYGNHLRIGELEARDYEQAMKLARKYVPRIDAKYKSGEIFVKVMA
jgi:hypothetical protein